MHLRACPLLQNCYPIYPSSSPHFLETVFQNYLNAVSWAAVLILPKENLTFNSHIVQFFFFFFLSQQVESSSKD